MERKSHIEISMLPINRWQNCGSIEGLRLLAVSQLSLLIVFFQFFFFHLSDEVPAGSWSYTEW